MTTTCPVCRAMMPGLGDVVMSISELDGLKSEIARLTNLWGDATIREATLNNEVKRLTALLNTPLTADFLDAVKIEAAHQRERWPAQQDASKSPPDWFWLIGYFAGKALAHHLAENYEKALHHTISTAAALANWHAAIKGDDADAALVIGELRAERVPT